MLAKDKKKVDPWGLPSALDPDIHLYYYPKDINVEKFSSFAEKKHQKTKLYDQIINLFFNSILDPDQMENMGDTKFLNFSDKTDQEKWCQNPPFTAVKNYIVSRETVSTNNQNLNDESTSVQPTTLMLHVHKVMNNGYGLATTENSEQLVNTLKAGDRVWFYVVPFTLKNEIVYAQVVENNWGYSVCDLKSVETKAENRIDAPCKYFGKCSGCQLQMITYKDQLEFKQKSVEFSFKHENSNFINSEIVVNEVIGSPKQFGYRTKLTPHFDLFKWMPREQTSIGFNYINRREVLDIEECIIGTPHVNSGLTETRKITKNNFDTFKRGATLLIRQTESLNETFVLKPKDMVTETVSTISTLNIDEQIYNKQMQLLDDLKSEKGFTGDLDTVSYKFQFQASSFFQNNNSVLPKLVHYVRYQIGLANKYRLENKFPEIKYLVDAYCGAGLFAIGCSSDFEKVVGIEISKESISNAKNNSLGIKNCEFYQGDASNIFEKVKQTDGSINFSPNQTAVIIDPPRKGSNPQFLNQLVEYAPAVIVYVACGVPAQARDINYLVRNGSVVLNPTETKNAENKPLYKISSIQPFDLFPQTFHVENVVTLIRIN
ncbi:hypothetical protein BB558_003813 [Smittium angustum]|uniref:TRAM domain-containing protein n=1 Tax=Smittium angustum TaxID=133377 RepID=A0A2U1J4Y3_SMIAN|nr:hypothetical protein BB558_003813 [Smittium angustum]